MSTVTTAEMKKVKNLFTLAFRCLASTTNQHEREKLLSMMLKAAVEKGYVEYVQHTMTLLRKSSGQQTAQEKLIAIHDELSPQQKNATVRNLFS